MKNHYRVEPQKYENDKQIVFIAINSPSSSAVPTHVA